MPSSSSRMFKLLHVFLIFLNVSVLVHSNCIKKLHTLKISKAEKGVTDPSKPRFYRICPGNVINIKEYDSSTKEYFGPGQMPIEIFYPNVHILCAQNGRVGSIENNCEITGGTFQVVIHSAEHVDKNFTNYALDNIKFEGFKFSGASETNIAIYGGNVLNSIGRSSEVHVKDCLFYNNVMFASIWMLEYQHSYLKVEDSTFDSNTLTELSDVPYPNTGIIASEVGGSIEVVNTMFSNNDMSVQSPDQLRSIIYLMSWFDTMVPEEGLNIADSNFIDNTGISYSLAVSGFWDGDNSTIISSNNFQSGNVLVDPEISNACFGISQMIHDTYYYWEYYYAYYYYDAICHETFKTTDAPTVSPTFSPTPLPTVSPTSTPSLNPTISSAPTTMPTALPSSSPSVSPSESPSSSPSVSPSESPNSSPSASPSESPSSSPSVSPSESPSSSPSVSLSESPSSLPSASPSDSPSSSPSASPSETPFIVLNMMTCGTLKRDEIIATKILGENSVGLCQSSCAEMEGCEGFHYNDHAKRCIYLKYNPKHEVENATKNRHKSYCGYKKNSSSVSPTVSPEPTTSPITSPFVIRNRKICGKQMYHQSTVYENIESIEICKDYCISLGDSLCPGFFYNGNTKRCLALNYNPKDTMEDAHNKVQKKAFCAYRPN